MPRPRHDFRPRPEQMALWPTISGNAVNGLGERAPRRASPIYWHEPDRTPHGPLQRWFYENSFGDPQIAAARAERQAILDSALAPVAPEPAVLDAEQWTAGIKAAALAGGADIVGITEMRPEWVFEGFEVGQRWIVMLGVAHDYARIRTAPEPQAGAEVIRQYGRGNQAAKAVASWIRERGHDAHPHGGPMAGPVVLIPPAIACGFGELGKHGSIIHRRLGSSFRLAAVLTDVPLLADAPDRFGADAFCARCRVCSDACPPDAILPDKQWVRGEFKWYVDFDRCLPYFNEHMGCAICIAVCPWSRPGIADNLVAKMARRFGAAPDAAAADRAPGRD
ncbi:MAG: epoxyqueuosine reductase [Burkholderiales bacterium]|nr:MAG: epoxyqueuosine reductase [Burkholderiales bacterium]